MPATALEVKLADVVSGMLGESASEPLAPITRVEIHASSLQITFPIRYSPVIRSRLIDGEHASVDPVDHPQLRPIVPIRMRLRGGRTWIVGEQMRGARPDKILVGALRAAHAMLARDAHGLPVIEAIPPSPYPRSILRLAFLAPELQQAILAGRQQSGLTLARLMGKPIPLLWSEQAGLLRS